MTFARIKQLLPYQSVGSGEFQAVGSWHPAARTGWSCRIPRLSITRVELARR